MSSPLTIRARIVRAIGWLAGLFVIHAALSSAFHATVVADHNLTKSDNEFLAGPDHVEVLVAGASHARNAVAPRGLLVPAANIALGGDTTIKIHYRLKKLLRAGKTADIVILSAGDEMFVDHTRDQYHPYALWGRRVNFLRLATEADNPKAMGIGWLRTWVLPYADELPIWIAWSMGTRSHFLDRELVGNMSRLRPRQRIQASRERYDKIFGEDEPVDPLKREYLDRTIKTLHRRNIKVVLVRYPVIPAYSRIVTARGVRARAEAHFEEIREDDRIVYLDFVDAFNDDLGLFDDPDHLNTAGRRKFTNLLRRELQRRGLLKRQD